jgi:hypothetical protein
MLFVEKLDMTPVLAPMNPVVIVDAMRKIVLIVLACKELVKIAKVDNVLGIFARPPLPVPGRAPLIEDTHKSSVLIVLVKIVLALRELVRIENVDKVDGIDVNDPLPGRAPLIDDTHKSNVLKVVVKIVLA